MIGVITATLNSLGFVRWDRCVPTLNDGWLVYGWIERDDDHADFVLIEFDEVGVTRAFTTSSARWGPALHEVLVGEGEHVPCERVIDQFPRTRRTVGPKPGGIAGGVLDGTYDSGGPPC